MSRTTFLNACSQLKLSCSQTIEYKQDAVEQEVRDVLGSLLVPAFHFLASYQFDGKLFYGAAPTKKAAVEQLFSRLNASEHFPKPPVRVDPTVPFADDLFVIVARRSELAISLSIFNSDDTMQASLPTTLYGITRSRHEALFSLIRNVMRENPELSVATHNAQ
nr:Hypothetical protein CDS [Astacus astacus]